MADERHDTSHFARTPGNRLQMADASAVAKPEAEPVKQKLFGGCGCGSPHAFKLPLGSVELFFPDNPSRGRLVVTPQELKALRGMIAKAEKDALI